MTRSQLPEGGDGTKRKLYLAASVAVLAESEPAAFAGHKRGEIPAGQSGLPGERQEWIQPGVVVIQTVRFAQAHSNSGPVKDVDVED